MTGGPVRQALQRERSSGRIGEKIARLQERMDGVLDDIQDIRSDVTDQRNDVQRELRSLRQDVDALKRFQAWLFGLGAGLGATATLLLNGIKDWWRH